MKKVKAWETSDGQTFSTVEDAQKHELRHILDNAFKGIAEDQTLKGALASVVEVLLTQADDVVNILTLKDDSRPAARKVGSGRKKKGDQAVAAPTAEPQPA